MSQVDVLAIFAHPDDVELTVAGTMLKMKHLGYRTGVLDVTQGEMGTRGTVEGRAEEAAEAETILKLDIRENLGLPDGQVFADDGNDIKARHSREFGFARRASVRRRSVADKTCPGLAPLEAEIGPDTSGRRFASRS